MPAINNTNASLGKPYDPNDPELKTFQAKGQELRFQAENLASLSRNATEFQFQEAGGLRRFWVTVIPLLAVTADTIAKNITNFSYLENKSNSGAGGTQLSGPSRVKRGAPVVRPIPPVTAKNPVNLEEKVHLINNTSQAAGTTQRTDQDIIPGWLFTENRGDTQLSGHSRVKRGAPTNGSIMTQPKKQKVRWAYTKNQPGACSSTKVIAECERYVEMESNFSVDVNFLPVNANEILNNEIKNGFDVWCLCKPKNLSEFKIVSPSGDLRREVTFAHPSFQPDECKTQAVLTQCLNELSKVAEIIRYYLITHEGHECHCPPPIAPYDVRYVVVDSAVQLRITAQPTDQSIRPEWIFTENQLKVCSKSKITTKCKEIIKGNENLAAVNANYVLLKQLSNNDIMCLCAPVDLNKVTIVPPSGPKKVRRFRTPLLSEAVTCETESQLTRCSDLFDNAAEIRSDGFTGSCDCSPPIAPYDIEYEMEDAVAQVRIIAQPVNQNGPPERAYTERQPGFCFSPKIITRCEEISTGNEKSVAVNANYVLNGKTSLFDAWCLCAPKNLSEFKIIPYPGPKVAWTRRLPSQQPDECITPAAINRCNIELRKVAKFVKGYWLTNKGNKCHCLPPPIAPYDIEYKIRVVGDLLAVEGSEGGSEGLEIVRAPNRLSGEMSAFPDTNVTSGARRNVPLRSSLSGVSLLLIGRLLRPVGLV